ncbi:hypothetical protein I3760_13G128500 [Carya illinoinensis]|nr:hypothetical protein I3760_13G128500 [Carya illinoinensis]
MAAVRGIDGPMPAANSCSFVDLISVVPHPIPDVHLAPRAHKTMEGEVYFLFSKEEIVKSAKPFRFSLVLKFLRQRPSLDAIRIFINNRWGLSGIAMVSAMRKPRNVFVRLTLEEDFNKAFFREVCDINSVAYHPFHWTHEFSKEEEPSMVPVWIFLPGLAPNFYHPSILKSLMSPIEKFIRSDNSTRCATRTDGARVCLEVDVAKSPLLSFWIGVPSLQEVADQGTSNALVLGSVVHIVDTEGEKVENLQLVELQGHGLEDKANDGNVEVVCFVSEEMVPVNSEVMEVSCFDSMEVVPRAVKCSGMSKESPMVCVNVQCLEEVPGLIPVDVSQDALVSIVVDHAEKVHDGLCVESVAEKGLTGVSSDQLASLMDPEMGDGKTVLNKDVCSDLDIRDAVKEKGEDVHNKIHRLYWNVRGVKSSNSRLKKIMKVYKPKMFVIAEPFLCDEQLDDVKKMLGFDYGFSNGAWNCKLWILWMNDVNVRMVSCGTQPISVLVADGVMQCKISFVYAKCLYEQWRVLWEELARESNSNDPWLVTGDFNIIANDGERCGGRPRLVVAMEEFNSWIHNCGLMELKFLGKSFSWCNGHAGNTRSWARLDCSLVDQKFFDAFLDSVLRYLPRTSSDHAPMVILLVKNVEVYGPSPFHF